MENPIKIVIDIAKKNQKEACELLNLKQSTLSKRMNKEMMGTLEWSLEVAKELGVRSYTIQKNGYQIKITRK